MRLVWPILIPGWDEWRLVLTCIVPVVVRVDAALQDAA
jgi:hypothetical protein